MITGTHPPVTLWGIFPPFEPQSFVEWNNRYKKCFRCRHTQQGFVKYGKRFRKKRFNLQLSPVLSNFVGHPHKIFHREVNSPRLTHKPLTKMSILEITITLLHPGLRVNQCPETY